MKSLTFNRVVTVVFGLALLFLAYRYTENGRYQISPQNPRVVIDTRTGNVAQVAINETPELIEKNAKEQREAVRQQDEMVRKAREAEKTAQPNDASRKK